MSKRIEQGFVLWFTGLPCSGKTTVADKVAEVLRKQERKVERLDGDILRKSLSADLGFSKEDRQENIKRVTFISKLLSRNGIGVVTTFVSPYRDIRNKARKEVTNFIEVFVDCPLEVCKRRDVKGMYKLAETAQIENFTGVSDPYEKPKSPEIIIDTDKETVEESCQEILKYLKSKSFI
ncbi:MAG: adenylyl-sulfate kinase [Candidatus Omnitrophota bacterium]